MNKYIYILFLFFLINSCNGMAQDNMQKAADSLIKKYCTQKMEYRDSLYAIYTLRQWRDSGFLYWNNVSEMYKMTNDDIQPYISAVFYSPDRKKMVFWLGEKMPNAYTIKQYSREKNLDRIEPNGPDTIYNIVPIIGFRDDTTRPFKIAVFPGRATGGYTKEVADRSLAEWMFIDLKHIGKTGVIQSGPHKGELETKAYGYNLQDKDFWDKCWLWQKDTVGSNGLYPFQEDHFTKIIPGYEGHEKCNKCAMAMDLNSPKIDYPKEILDMYGK